MTEEEKQSLEKIQREKQKHRRKERFSKTSKSGSRKVRNRLSKL